MEMDRVHRLSGDHPWSISRVTGKDLDPEKHRYVLWTSLCGYKPVMVSKSEFFRQFPEEIRSVVPADLKPAKRGCSFNEVALSSFGLLATLLRQRDFREDGLVRSPEFIPIVDTVNGIARNDCEQQVSYGGKTFQSSCADELLKLESRIADLQARIQDLEEKNELFKSFLPFSSPLVTSSPSHCSNENINMRCGTNTSDASSSGISSDGSTDSNSNSVIEETLKNPSIGPTLKKRKIAYECSKVSSELEGVWAKYHESLSCALGNSFLYGGDEDKEKVSETLSKVVNLLMDAKGTKKGLTELLLPETYQRLLGSMKVPDWVLLYFKLQTRLPDAGRQTLLNLTQLGKSRVSHS